jgi:Holliday junction resolvasome RuvABC endonuclease subunit
MGRALIGIDPGLVATSVFLVDGNGQTRSFTFGGVIPVQSEGEVRDRITRIIREVRDVVRDFRVTAAAMEGPAYQSVPNFQLIEFRGALRFALEDPEAMEGHALQVHVVPPSSARKVALGKIPTTWDEKKNRHVPFRGPELKAWILSRVRLCFPVSSHDDADACVVAEWLALKIGEPALLAKARGELEAKA